jgi:TonB family protein
MARVTRRRASWAALLIAGLPILYAAAAVQIAPAQQEPGMKVHMNDVSEFFNQGIAISASDAAELERQVTSEPEDLAARSKLMSCYYTHGNKELLLEHMFWLIEHHPEAEVFQVAPPISPRRFLTGRTLFQRAEALWLEQADRHGRDVRVLLNAARAVEQYDVDAARRLYSRARQIDPNNPEPTSKLAELDANAFRLDALARADSKLDEQEPFQRVRVGAAVQETRLIKRVEPVYPPEQVHIHGTVKFNAIIGPDGRVKNLQLVSGHPLLVAPALEAVRQWEYRPTLLNGAPVEVVTQVDVHFAAGHTPGGVVGGSVGSSGVVGSVVGSVRERDSSQRIRVGAAVQETKLSKRVEPVYPPKAREARLEGTVKFTAIIGPDGRIKTLQLVSGHPLLVTAAMDAVRQWEYRPTLLNGDPVEVITEVNVHFMLHEAPPPQDTPVMQ